MDARADGRDFLSERSKVIHSGSSHIQGPLPSELLCASSTINSDDDLDFVANQPATETADTIHLHLPSAGL